MPFEFCNWCKAEKEIIKIMIKYNLDDKDLNNTLSFFCESNCDSKEEDYFKKFEKEIDELVDLESQFDILLKGSIGLETLPERMRVRDRIYQLKLILAA